MSVSATFAVIDLVVVTILVVYRLDVRLVLLAGALPLFGATLGLGAFCAQVAGEMVNAGTVVPICSAVGFAYVLRVTECDQHLVHLLLRPLRRLRGLLVPGGIAAGYLVNTTIVSQTGTAAVLGPILIPLLRAGGISPVTAGAILLLGSSMGGELFNPGAVEMRKLAELTGLSGPAVVASSAPLNMLACCAALLSFWFLARWPEKEGISAQVGTKSQPAANQADSSINPIKAMVPAIPLILLFSDHGLGSYSPLRTLVGPPKILAAMLVGIVLAGLTSPRLSGQLTTAFFEGAGYAYTHVISLIVAASTFAEGIRLSGLVKVIVTRLVEWPSAALIVAAVAPWTLAVISGTGIAPAVSIMEFFVPVASSLKLNPVLLGTVAALGAHFGRTMSPAAAVVIMSARLAGVPAFELIRRVTIPLLIGGLVLIAAAMAWSY
jgi:C4-dicarboxylate transporter, DcuC family